LQPINKIDELNIFFEKVNDMKNIDEFFTQKINSKKEDNLSKASFGHLF
jgi:hypothetical protein